MPEHEEFGAALAPGTRLTGKHGDYELGQVLGQGGFGITYAAARTRDGLRVAIKEYYPSHCAERSGELVRAHQGWEEDYARRLERFTDEGRTLLALNAVASVVRAYDAFEANGTAYLVMEYLDGVPLFKKAESLGGRIPPEVLLPAMRPLIRDLETIHAMGLLHRDIAPDNIMWMPDGTLKLIDFGSARTISSQKKTVLLKPGFAPVEQYLSDGREQGPWTDIYSLCATLYYLLSGVYPPASQERLMQAGAAEQSGSELAGLITLGVALTPEEDAAISRGMAVQPRQRTQSARELERELYGTQFTTSVYEVDPPPEPKRKLSLLARILDFLGFGR